LDCCAHTASPVEITADHKRTNLVGTMLSHLAPNEDLVATLPFPGDGSQRKTSHLPNFPSRARRRFYPVLLGRDLDFNSTPAAELYAGWLVGSRLRELSSRGNVSSSYSSKVEVPAANRYTGAISEQEMLVLTAQDRHGNQVRGRT
jgi:hypothetical protein